ncbi:MAG: NAD(P)/FAD-dependent oxidoreductase, partial [Berryella intestinalis]|uniref:NAD(P)/FAD-dependent oxidoreductase n=1 Tax=Berryella intestinalis TaxID=1531429 RepID=UPI002A7546DF
MRLAVVGGGAAGFFLAVNAAQAAPDLEVVVFEQRRRVLSKLEASGGGRCNCTNTFSGVKDLREVYPRGANLIKRQFKLFGPRDALAWFEARGVPLAIMEDQRVFPRAQDSRAISGCLKAEADRLGVRVRTECRIDRPEALLRDRGGDFDFVAVTIGGTPDGEGCVPSLFAFNLEGGAPEGLAGVSAPEVVVSVPSAKLAARGALLVTHEGFSGPAILKLS